MNKLEQLLNNFKDYGDWSPSSWNQFTDKDMKEFAIQYAKCCMKTCCAELQFYGDLHEDFDATELIELILDTDD